MKLAHLGVDEQGQGESVNMNVKGMSQPILQAPPAQQQQQILQFSVSNNKAIHGSPGYLIGNSNDNNQNYQNANEIIKHSISPYYFPQQPQQLLYMQNTQQLLMHKSPNNIVEGMCFLIFFWFLVFCFVCLFFLFFFLHFAFCYPFFFLLKIHTIIYKIGKIFFPTEKMWAFLACVFYVFIWGW